jgi:hypothetical protein
LAGGIIPPISTSAVSSMNAKQIKAEMSRIQTLLKHNLSLEEREMLEEDYEDLRQELIEVTCY